ncbi:MAG: aminotransferase class IV [Planctomycetaceae bacterium]|nr:aminotransferase class IV [Planctomycetaceae bacterium]
MLAWINGLESPLESASLRPDDLGLQRGYAAFEFLRSEHGRLFHLDDHLRRLETSARLIGLTLPMNRSELATLCHGLAERSGLAVPAIRILLTGGYAAVPTADRRPNLIVIAEPVTEFADELYCTGIAIIGVEFQRECPVAKTNNYLNTFRVESLMKASQADDVVYHWNGMVTEAPRSNIFAVIADRVVTPRHDILLGVTRQTILDLAVSHGLTVEERVLSLSELQSANEIFLTSTTRRVLPVTRLDSRPVGDGQVGRVTTQIMQLFRSYIDSGNWE